MQHVQRASSWYWRLQLASLALRVVLLVAVGVTAVVGVVTQAQAQVVAEEDSLAHQRPGQARHQQLQRQHQERRRQFKERQQRRQEQLKQLRKQRERLTRPPVPSLRREPTAVWGPATITTMACSQA